MSLGIPMNFQRLMLSSLIEKPVKSRGKFSLIDRWESDSYLARFANGSEISEIFRLPQNCF